MSTSVEELISTRQYTVAFAEKRRLFPPLLAQAFQRNAEGCPEFGEFLSGYGFDPAAATDLLEFPPLPVTAFKRFRLGTCPASQIVRELNSSSTTGQQPSRIFLDKATMRSQTRAVVAILKSFLGVDRRPYLVFDVPGVNETTSQVLTARGAAIRGLQSFASETVYGLKLEDEEMAVDWPSLQEFCQKYADTDVLVFGFTYLVWSRVLPQLRRHHGPLRLRRAVFFHGGGWKKLEEERVSKEDFTRSVADGLGCSEKHVHDFYGMVEQVGSIFVDCEEGHKHAPNFATVIIRDPLTMERVPVGSEGLIEVISLLPTSYPGQVILTEDCGRLVAIDDCPCGRMGVAFDFTSRVHRVELRGCGDTLASQLQRENACDR